MKKMKKITFEYLEEMMSDDHGYCKTCDFTGTDGLEPDATDCMCHYCKAETTEVDVVIAYTDPAGIYYYNIDDAFEFKKSGKIRRIPNDFKMIFKVFGTTASAFKKWYNRMVQDGYNNAGREDYFSKHSYLENDGRHSLTAKKNKFMYSIWQELDNVGQGFTEASFLVRMTLQDFDDIRNARSIRLHRDVMCGLHDSWNGGGSILEIDLKFDTIADMTDDGWDYYIDGTNGYGVDDVRGMTKKCWDGTFEIEKGDVN